MRKSLLIRLALLVLLGSGVASAIWYVQSPRQASLLNRKPKYAHTVSTISDPFIMDRMYGSMQGPWKTNPVMINPEGTPRLAWIQGIDFTATDTEGNPLPDQQNLCHGQVRYEDPKIYRHMNSELFDNKRTIPAKWFTVIQGQNGIHFPKGFGIPLMSNEPLEAMTMAINQVEGRSPFVIKMKTDVHYIYDYETKTPMKPLGKFVVDVRVPVESEYAVEHAHDDHEHDPTDPYSSTCAVDEFENVVTAKPALDKSRISTRDGQKVVFHFLVPPGRHVYRYKFPGSDYIPFDTTVHHISAHLHVYGESIAFIDNTQGGKELFRSFATPEPGMKYLLEMSHYESEVGIPMYMDHDYEIEAVYVNSSDEPIDAMAVMYMYFYDKAFAGEITEDVSDLKKDPEGMM